MPYSFNMLGVRVWGLVAASGGAMFAADMLPGAAWSWCRNVPRFNEADVASTEEYARYPCKTLEGHDVVVRNHYVRSKGEEDRLPASCFGNVGHGGIVKSVVDRLSACFSNEANSVLASVDPADGDNQLHLVREVSGNACAPLGAAPICSVVEGTAVDGVTHSPSVASSSWPPGTSKYTSMTMETSRSVDGAGAEASLRRWSNSVTQQSLVRCDPLAPASLNCAADASYLGAPYLRVMLSALLLLPFPLPRSRVAVLGVGGGSLPSFLQQYFSREIMHLDLVDVEEQCFRAAVGDMGMRREMQGGTVACHVRDGNDFLRDIVGTLAATRNPGYRLDGLLVGSSPSGNSATSGGDSHSAEENQRPSHLLRGVRPVGCYDILFVDLFVGSDPPTFMTSPEFVSLCRDALSSIGVAAFNLPQSDPNFAQTCRHFFGPQNVYQVPVPASANIVLLVRRVGDEGVTSSCHGQGSYVAPRHFHRRARQLQKSHGLPYDLSSHYPIWWRFW